MSGHPNGRVWDGKKKREGEGEMVRGREKRMGLDWIGLDPARLLDGELEKLQEH